MDGISRSRGWDKEIPHGVLPMEQLVLSDKWARHLYPTWALVVNCYILTLVSLNKMATAVNFQTSLLRHIVIDVQDVNLPILNNGFSLVGVYARMK